MEQSSLWVLIGKKLNGEATPDDLRRLEQLLANKPVRSYLIELLEEVWKKRPDRRPEAENPYLEERWESLSGRLFPEQEAVSDDARTRRRVPGRLLIGLLAAAACLTAFLWYRYQGNATVQPAPQVHKMHEIVVSNASRRTLQLPDGTRVWLNAGSKLVYREDFGREKRDVWLEGEAFFEVAADEHHPFIVNTDRITVRVLGTAFNVRAYRNDQDIEASLVRGKISVSLKNDPEKNIILSPHEKFVVNKDNISTTPAIPRINAVKYQVQALAYEGKDSSLLVETAWVSHKLAFTNQPFEEVARQMERWYDVRIHFENDSLKGILMSGIFDKETIEQALGVLQIMVKFKYTVNGRDINISN